MDKVIPVKVALRIRPLVSRETADACTECLRTVDSTQVILGKDKPFTYDCVFSKLSPQVEIYETAVQPLLSSLFKGYNATVLAYGQTGSGKTYTMGTSHSTLIAANQFLSNNPQDAPTESTDFDEVGVIPRVLNDLFRTIEDEQRADKDAKFEVKVSFVEVYNEEIKDLFNLKSAGNSEPLNIREENNTIRVANLSEITVSNAHSTIQLLEKGSSLRVVGGTAMNDQSSRSHAIFTITLEQTRLGSGSDELIKSKFHLVDLAGSERQSKTKAEGLRLKEGININLGLLALGNVISVLGEDNPSNKPKHVPYRESKLTRLLQDSLGGNSHTLMIACVSPADSNMEESLNTLRYADRARKIKNKPIVNIDPQAAELITLRQQVQVLKAQIFQLTGGAGAGENLSSINVCNNTDFNQIKEECEKLKLENLKMVNELTRLLNVNNRNYERIQQLEIEKEEQKRKFDEIKSIFDKLSKDNEENSQSQSPDQTLNLNPQQHNTSKALLSEMQSKLGEFEKLRDKEQTNLINQGDEDLNTATNEPADKDYALRQAQMQFQLGEFDSELMKKQYLHQKMLDNLTQLSGKDTKLESNMDELKSRIDSLEKEKIDLLDQIRISDKKQSEQKRDRLKQLEQEVFDLKRKEKETQKMIKIKEENEKQCEKLRQEIQHIKQERVKLIKQMKQDTDTFRKYKQEKEKEVNHLKAMERKRMVEISKLQEGNNRQENILRRKNEEISRIQKQLRETSEKQKLVAEKRQQTFDRKDNSSLGERLRLLITQELELSVNLAEARINLNTLIAERKETAAELAKLQEELTRMDQEDKSMPPPKRKFDIDATYIAGANDANNTDDQESQLQRLQLEQQIERIKEDIECKNIQINEVQQMVIEGDQDDKAKHLFNNIHGLLEAKVLLKHLYNSGVQYLLDSKLKQTQFDNTSSSLNQELKELRKKYEITEEEFNKSKKTFNNEKSELIRHYEQRIFSLLQSGVSAAECPDDDRFTILLEQIGMLEKDRELLDDKLKNRVQGMKSSRFASDITNKDDFKRAKKIKREQRRTRVIRTTPLDEEESGANSPFSSIAEQSPMANLSCDDTMPATPADDRSKDPDWAQTPLRVKGSKAQKPSIRRGISSGQLRKTRSSSRLISTNEMEMTNDENKV